MFKYIPYPRQVILVSCQAETEIMGKEVDKKNLMTLSWHMPVSFDPPLYAISVGKERLSYNLIKKSGVFCVNFMPYELKDKVLFCGRNSGRTKDKFTESGLKEEECDRIHCPRVKQAAGFLECEVVDRIEAGDHIIFIGEIINAKQNRKVKRLFHSGGDDFTTEQ